MRWHAKTDGQCKKKGRNPKKEPKSRNARNKKTLVTLIKNTFNGFISRMDKAEKRLSEVEYKIKRILKK